LEIGYWANQENVICIDLWRKEQCIARTYLHTAADNQGQGWYNAQQRLEKPSSYLAEQSSILGTGRVWIENVEICDELGNGRFVFEPQDLMRVRCHYRTHANQGVPVAVEFLLAFHRDGVTDVLRITAPPVSLPENSEGVIEFIWKDCALARGRFTFTLMAVRLATSTATMASSTRSMMMSISSSIAGSRYPLMVVATNAVART